MGDELPIDWTGWCEAASNSGLILRPGDTFTITNAVYIVNPDPAAERAAAFDAAFLRALGIAPLD